MITFIDLFAGIGGFRLALEGAGAKCVFSSEIDKYARQVYKSNFAEEPSGDITKIDEKDIPAHDVLCAGFPCQAFSLYGKRDGFLDQRGTLFFEILRIAKHHKPKVILLENVKGLVNHDGGNTLKTIIYSLESLGYTVSYEVIDASMFEVPQIRQRIFIVAIRDNVKYSFIFPKGTLTAKRLKNIKESNVDAKHFLSESRNNFINHKRTLKKFIYGYYLTGPNDLVHTILTSKYEHNLIIDNTKPTGKFKNIKAKVAKDNIINKQNVRRLTPREYARLQGISDSFNFPVSNKQIYRLCGNSVVVPVVEAIFAEIKKIL